MVYLKNQLYRIQKGFSNNFGNPFLFWVGGQAELALGFFGSSIGEVGDKSLSGSLVCCSKGILLTRKVAILGNLRYYGTAPECLFYCKIIISAKFPLPSPVSPKACRGGLEL